MNKCLICKTEFEPFMTFGQMPIANGFLKKEQFTSEYFFEMKVGCCPACNMFQLINQPDREQMFNENYAFFSGTSKLMGEHFKEFAESVKDDFIKESSDPFVVEIGSNDGIMLRNFAEWNIRHLGVEPSANVAAVASSKGINTIVEFFDKACAEKIIAENGHADAFIAANVMCHIPYMHSIVEGIKTLLKPNGIAMFEDPYLGKVIEQTTFDQIYDEHVFLFSALSVSKLFAMHDMELIDVKPQVTHGGSMRYILANKGMHKVSSAVGELISKEQELGLDKAETFLAFKHNCETFREKLTALIKDIRSTGSKIAGYAATSKSTTIINYCGITTEDIDYICDTTPIKQGKFSPGAHIPVKTHEEFQQDYPEYALLFGYNHSKEIMAKEQQFMAQGGKWVTYVPEIEVV
jgi:methylation protein EvaC